MQESEANAPNLAKHLTSNKRCPTSRIVSSCASFLTSTILPPLKSHKNNFIEKEFTYKQAM